jgi:hypothetical protein
LIDAKVPRTAEGDRRFHPTKYLPAVTAEKTRNDVIRPNAGTAGCASTVGKAFPFLTDKIQWPVFPALTAGCRQGMFPAFFILGARHSRPKQG